MRWLSLVQSEFSQMIGFIQFMDNTGEQLAMIEDEQVWSWENILRDDDAAVEFLSGLRIRGYPSAFYLNPCFGIYDGIVVHHAFWDDSQYTFLEGPMIKLSSGRYLYLLNATPRWEPHTWDSRFAGAICSWDGSAAEIEHTSVFTLPSGYSSLSPVAASIRSTRPYVINVVLYATETDGDRGLLLSELTVNPSLPNPFQNITYSDFMEAPLLPQHQELIPEPREVVFISTRPVEAIGAGNYSGNVALPDNNYIWVFRIYESLRAGIDPVHLPISMRLHSSNPASSSSVEFVVDGSTEGLYLLTIFTIDGRLVYRESDISVDQPFAWNGTDAEGQGFPGVYIARISDETTGQSASVKFLRL